MPCKTLIHENIILSVYGEKLVKGRKYGWRRKIKGKKFQVLPCAQNQENTSEIDEIDELQSFNTDDIFNSHSTLSQCLHSGHMSLDSKNPL